MENIWNATHTASLPWTEDGECFHSELLSALLYTTTRVLKNQEMVPGFHMSPYILPASLLAEIQKQSSQMTFLLSFMNAAKITRIE